ncbi:MAG: Sua5/YciO/YrdC/YwlC family protein, partial [Clostridium sp.]
KNNKDLPSKILSNTRKIGVLLPYSPLHYLLFDEELEVLVFTSANTSGNPIIYKNEEDLNGLKNIADYFLIHNRTINMPIDDSVVNVVLNEERVIRCGRGYSPMAKKFEVESGILALGSQYKNTISISNNKYIFTTPYIGDIDNIENLNILKKQMNYLKNIYNIKIKTLCYDMHPNYWSSDFIKDYNYEKIGVYHHHAHVVSCMVDNGAASEAKTIIGIAFDGSGYGEDGQIWGSEFLICNLKSFKRVGHFSYMDMVTGDGAVSYPWKMGVSLIYSCLKENINLEISNLTKILPSNFSPKNINLIMKIIDSKINTPLTSSMGRLFDGVASILGFNEKVTYEGEAAIYLQNLAEIFIYESFNNIEQYKEKYKKVNKDKYKENRDKEYKKVNPIIEIEEEKINLYEEYYKYDIEVNEEINIISTSEIIKNILEDLKSSVSRGEIAMKFHNTIVEASLDICIKLRGKYSINIVALTGGVFQNEILFEKLYSKLTKNNFNVLTHKTIPCNDSGVSVGQLIIANEISGNQINNERVD